MQFCNSLELKCACAALFIQTSVAMRDKLTGNKFVDLIAVSRS